MKTRCLTLTVLFAGIALLNARAISGPHIPMTREDSLAINALNLYADSTRLDIFVACEYPGAVVRIASLQKNSSSSFSDLISGYTKPQQEDVWNLSRYPGLIPKLVEGGKKSDAYLNAILAAYPQEIHDVALQYGRDNYDLLKSINDLQTQTNAEFESIITSYPDSAQTAFRHLLKLPEVMGLLNDHLSLTVRVGDHFKRDPQWVIRKSDSAHQVEEAQNALEVQQWQQTVSSDTGVQNDLKAAANEYADSNGYQDSDADAPVNPDDVQNYYCEPYSYWFGYPSWYPADYWYPYPNWWDWGFYYGAGGISVFGMPSYYFANWYFYSPGHWNRYPRFGSAFINHYYGHGRKATYNANSLIAHQWVQDNRNYLPHDFMSNSAVRTQSIKEVGQMTMEAQRANGGKISPVIRDNYVQNNRNKYPTLNTNPQHPAVPEERINTQMQQPEKQPAVRPAQLQQVQMNNHVNTNTAPQRQAAPAPAKSNYNSIQNSQNYHRAVWQQAQPTYHPAPAQAPARQYSAPAQAPASHYSAPSSSGGGGGARRK